VGDGVEDGFGRALEQIGEAGVDLAIAERMVVLSEVKRRKRT
jgi:hypothetical protein